MIVRKKMIVAALSQIEEDVEFQACKFMQRSFKKKIHDDQELAGKIVEHFMSKGFTVLKHEGDNDVIITIMW
jgi:SOS response regulatory protein OraA/RecX